VIRSGQLRRDLKTKAKLTKKILRDVLETKMTWAKVGVDERGGEKESKSSERVQQKDETRGEGEDLEALMSNVMAW
jgi:hypothetical protein